MAHIKEDRQDDGARVTRGDTQTAQGENQAPKARTPNERDESTDSQSPEAASTRRIGQIAHDDVAEGQQDTDKGPVLDATYEKQKGGRSS